MESDRNSLFDDPGRYRRTTQALAPLRSADVAPEGYDIYPSHPLPAGSIAHGFGSLAQRIARCERVIIDGFAGIPWDDFRKRLDGELRYLGVQTEWLAIDNALHEADAIGRLVRPFLGGDDPLWGTRFTGTIDDFFDKDKIQRIVPSVNASLSILYGTGASLGGWHGYLVYVDLPKNEIQYRARAGCATNLASDRILPPKEAYKRSYFVDWPSLGQLRRRILTQIDLFVDGQRADDPVFASGKVVRGALREMSRSFFRARPWFEPGPWGGDWMKRRIRTLPQEAPNYAWSFELIAPENGLMFRSDDYLLELSFDTLMQAHASQVLGRAYARFGEEFPIRFDYLDTVNGGNLSVQCHPRPDYIRRHFGENFTQDETYYIVDAEPGARVYLGFTADADADLLRQELEESARTGATVDIDRYVNSMQVSRGDLLLIPNGTIHGSGAGNLVLEISATPYIFTFKMYDWIRRDLDGNLRPLNIERAWENLYVDRRGDTIAAKFRSTPRLLREEPGRRLVHLPTHPEHFYDVVRYEFDDDVIVETDGDCHVMNLVEGEAISVEVEGCQGRRINTAESFVVPADAGRYRLVNRGPGRAKVVRAWVKRE